MLHFYLLIKEIIVARVYGANAIQYTGCFKDKFYIETIIRLQFLFVNLFKKMFTNLNRIVTPKDRVLIIYGAGHKDILVDLIKDRVDWEYYDINQILYPKK
ncbi:DUF5694 domain-containing protein [Aquimarina muelleri]|uniref:Uncharacterized protein n=1 Tax=Aquimarina muelleri TaxID=279356 RepID=A0A918JTP8_9FLAO|nr:DUF5694 domain-containing protein [Aquimarina muelleri]MCX2763560.1 DUF5694 domain-containing protein [Aquimarina muelleri]GGX14389.1 hypothetical protein GCM10007384_14940 [Aquimarina muelleri]